MLYPRSECAAASAIAMALNLITAIAPPVPALLRKTLGAVNVMWALVACGSAAVITVLSLTLIHRAAVPPADE